MGPLGRSGGWTWVGRGERNEGRRSRVERRARNPGRLAPTVGLLSALLLVGPVTLAGPSIRVEPAPVIVSPGETVRLKAVVQGPSEYRVRWILQGPVGDGGDIGTLTDDGVYTAPAGIPRGRIRIVAQISLGQYNLPVAAASVPVDIVPAGMKPPELGPTGGFAPPPPPPPPPEPGFAPPAR